MRRRSVRLLGAVAVAGALGGCQLGERPTLGPAPAPVGDDAIEAVLTELNAGSERAFRAEYSISTPSGETTTASVEQTAATSRTVVIGTTEYVVDGASRQTCEVGTTTCQPGLDAQPISVYAVTADFFGPSAVARLRREAEIRVGPTTATTETIADQPATCVTVPVADTASVFCALEGGPLARWRTTDVTIELTSFTAS